MTIPKFDDRRSSAIRAGLVDAAQTHRRPRQAWRGLLVFALSGVLAGGAVSGAVAITNRVPIANPDGTVLEGNPGVPAPDGILPGTPVVALLGDSTTRVFTGAATVAIAPPTGASHLRVTFTCLSPGSLAWGTGPDSNKPSLTCGASDVASDLPTWEDIPITENEDLEVSGTAEYALSLQYLSRIETAWGVNDRGETFGVAKPGLGEPDLLAAIGQDDDGREVLGYVRTQDLGGTVGLTPGEAAISSPEGQHELPLLAPDGTTRIGVFIDGD